VGTDHPKAAVFMIAFYPQFVPASRPLFATTALLAAVQVLIETAFYLTLAAVMAARPEPTGSAAQPGAVPAARPVSPTPPQRSSAATGSA
jgi:threonine/homoserine/homoserine lactone efflux protein